MLFECFCIPVNESLWNQGAVRLLQNQNGHSGVNIESSLSHTHAHTPYSVPFTLQKYIHSYKICFKFSAISLNLHLAEKSVASVSDLKKACLLFPSISLLIKYSTCACVFLTNLSDSHTYENMPLG